MYKRNCILNLSQRARASTGPDTLLDASKLPRAKPAQHDRARMQLTSGYCACAHPMQFLSAVTPMCGSRAEVRARMRTSHAGHDQSCALICWHHQQAQALRQSRVPLRLPSTRSKPKAEAAPAQRSRARKIRCTTPTPRIAQETLRHGKEAPLSQPAAIIGSTSSLPVASPALVTPPQSQAPA